VDLTAQPVSETGRNPRSDRRAPANAIARRLDIAGRVRIIPLEEGIHAVTVGAIAAQARSEGGLDLPVTNVSPGPAGGRGLVEIGLTAGATPGWVGAEGGTVVAKVPPIGGVVVITTYGLDEGVAPPELQVLRLDGPGVSPPAASAAVAFPDQSTREIEVEMTVHIQREGDRQLLAHGWVGHPGQQAQIEAFGLRPLSTLLPGDIQYMAFGPYGRQTPWVTDAKLCGTRGRGQPLTGFAIRLAPALRDRFDVIYEGSFFRSKVTGPSRNGEPCLPLVADDPLEAIRLRVIERIGA